MKFRKYLFDRNITITAFAKELGISRYHLGEIIHGRRLPGSSLMHKISQMTKGKVTEKDLSLKVRTWKE